MREMPDRIKEELLLGKVKEDHDIDSLIKSYPVLHDALLDDYEGEIESEWGETNPDDEELSRRFDDLLESIYLNGIPNDGPLLRELFNNWTDGLCRGGEISQYTYDECQYVGKYLKEFDS